MVQVMDEINELRDPLNDRVVKNVPKPPIYRLRTTQLFHI
jgi:hypothetical protein